MYMVNNGHKVFVRSKFNPLAVLSNILFWACIYFTFFLLLFSACFTSSYVQGDSMRPTYNNYASYEHKNDIVYVNKYAAYTHGDVVVIDKKADSKQIIKRVIAVEGDRVNIVAKLEQGVYKYYVQLNGQCIMEDYILQSSVPGESDGMREAYNSFNAFKTNNPQLNYVQSGDEAGALIVGKGQVFVLGDNRANSTDSTEEGCFNTADVVGKVEIVVRANQNVLWQLIRYFFWPW